jgi:hypothetical protein
MRFLFLALLLIARAMPARAAVGRVLSVKGLPSVFLKSDSSQQGLGPGFPLNGGDLVATDERSTAKIHLIDETILDVNVLSRVIIPLIAAPDSRERQVLIQIERGKVRAKVNRELERSKGRFEIHTQAAAMGVEGTDFVVEAFPPDANNIVRTTVTVIEGQVALRRAKDRDNPGGEKLVLTAGMSYTAAAKLVGEAIEQDPFRPEDVKKLERSAIDEVARASKLTNEAFLQAVSVGQGPGGFGLSTLQAVNRNLTKDGVPNLKRENAGETLFRKNFRDDQFNDRSNYVNLTIGFPQ